MEETTGKLKTGEGQAAPRPKRKYYPRRPRAAKPAAQAGAEAQAPVEGKAAQAPKPPKQAKKAQPAPAAEAAKKQAARQPRQAKAQQAPAPRGGRGGRPKMASPAAAAAAAAVAAASAAQPRQAKAPRQPRHGKNAPPLHIIPLGGLGEVGKNMTLYECKGDMFLVDCGLVFPDSEMFGVDLVIPDFSYLQAHKDQLHGLVITHGHEDHIGALPYFLRQFNVPVYATRLTCGLIRNKLEEYGLAASTKLVEIQPGQEIAFGCMKVRAIRVNHSIPDAVAYAIDTPAGVVIQTGDYKIDFTPVTDEMIDLATFTEYGRRGVLALLADSTNSERPGFSRSERSVGQSFMNLFARAEGKRIIIATFASNLQRIQQIIDMAVKYNRKVAISGRSMVNNTTMAFELGYLHAPENIIVDIESIHRYRPEELVIVTTGSQGEPMSALSRMSGGSHRNVRVGQGDFIIISATPIPGNEKMVTKVVNSLLRLGAEVIYESMYDVHTSGHAYQEEQKLMLAMVKPKFFIPVHGEYKHLKKHSMTAAGVGIPEKNIVIADIGDVIALTPDKVGIVDTVPSGRVLVDGLGVGDVGSVVLRDRRHLSQDGLIISVAVIDAGTGKLVSGPDIVSRGFVYMKEAEGLIAEAKDVTRKVIAAAAARGGRRNLEELRGAVRDQLSTLLYRNTKRSPMILPIIQEV